MRRRIDWFGVSIAGIIALTLVGAVVLIVFAVISTDHFEDDCKKSGGTVVTDPGQTVVSVGPKGQVYTTYVPGATHCIGAK